MLSHKRLGLWQRLLTALSRGLLGKSSHEYMKQFTGSEEYWDRALAAQRGWPQEQPRKPDRFRKSRDALVHPRPAVRGSAP
jgi:hypothetical protein